MNSRDRTPAAPPAGGSGRSTPQQILEACGRIFTRFDKQDSGNISFGVEIAGQRYFVKTAGAPGLSATPPDQHRLAGFRHLVQQRC